MFDTPMRLAVSLLAILSLAPRAHAQKKPNVIVIMADDLGYECIGANGCTSYKTPRLDALAVKGMRFTHCFVQPLCTPTRVQLMTGKYNIRNYINFGYMDPTATTFGNLFKAAGYATCIVGKWQLGQDPKLPEKFGFDEHCLWQHTRRPPRYANPGLEINGKEVDYTKGEYGPDLLSDYALDFITRKKAQPFFLYYPMTLTHSPYQPTPDSSDWNPKAMGEKVNQNKKHFGEMVTYMDKLVGKLVDRLDSLKLRDDTLILFIGDNGTGVGVTTNVKEGVVHGGKGKMTATGMHVPLIVSWPGKIPEGKINEDLIDSTDVLPTICASANVEIPAKLKIDGQAFWPQLRGEKGTPRTWFYSWYSRDGGNKEAREFAATHQYKLYRDGSWYDYRADADEKSPLPVPTSGDALAAHRQLSAVLGQFKDARPAAIEKKGKKK